MSVGIVDLALLRIAENGVGFRAFAEVDLRFFLVVGIAVRMPLHRCFPIRALDVLNRSCLADIQYFVEISLLCSAHIRYVKFPLLLVCNYIRCATRMDRYAHHRGPQNAPVKHISRLKHLKNRAVGMFVIPRGPTA